MSTLVGVFIVCALLLLGQAAADPLPNHASRPPAERPQVNSALCEIRKLPTKPDQSVSDLALFLNDEKLFQVDGKGSSFGFLLEQCQRQVSKGTCERCRISDAQSEHESCAIRELDYGWFDKRNRGEFFLLVGITKEELNSQKLFYSSRLDYGSFTWSAYGDRSSAYQQAVRVCQQAEQLGVCARCVH